MNRYEIALGIESVVEEFRESVGVDEYCPHFDRSAEFTASFKDFRNDDYYEYRQLYLGNWA